MMAASLHSSRKQALRASLFLLMTVVVSIKAAAMGSAEQLNLAKGPFYWREKKSVAQSMLSERKIVVSVTKQDGSWFFKGAGIAKAPAVFAFAEVQKYEKLQTLPDHFQNVNWNKESQILSLDIHFLTRLKSMKIHLEPDLSQSQLFFRIEEGWFQGLEGVLLIHDTNDLNLSEIGIVAQSSTTLKWIPDFVFSVAAEGVMHHVAESLRTLIEIDYKKSLEHNP